jgi:hypothetical protein
VAALWNILPCCIFGVDWSFGCVLSPSSGRQICRSRIIGYRYWNLSNRVKPWLDRCGGWKTEIKRAVGKRGLIFHARVTHRLDDRGNTHLWTPVYCNETTLRYIPEGCGLHTRRREKLKSQFGLFSFSQFVYRSDSMADFGCFICTSVQLSLRNVLCGR